MVDTPSQQEVERWVRETWMSTTFGVPLILVPYSVARSPSFRNTELAIPGDEGHVVPGTRFRYRLRRGPVSTLFVPHPSALRLDCDGRKAVVLALGALAREALKSPR